MQIARWRRFGKDRLYVKDDSGAEIGWWDLASEAAHPADPGFETLLTEAVRTWRASNGVAAAPPAVPECEDVSQDACAVVATSAPEPGPVAEAVPGRDVPDQAIRRPTIVTAASSTGNTVTETPSHPVRHVLVRTALLQQEPKPEEVPLTEPPPEPVDLALNRPGQQLASQIEAARAAGEKPTLLRRFFLGKNAYSTWERGAIGERKVAEQLAKLISRDPRWACLHSIPVGNRGSDIDHVVIGPAGVFTINSKYHRGAKIWVGGDTVMIDGVRQPYVRNSRHEAGRASRLLSAAVGEPVEVRGIVAIVDAVSFTIRKQPVDVHVTPRKQLVKYLRSLPVVLDENRRNAILAVARWGATWHPGRG